MKLYETTDGFGNHHTIKVENGRVRSSNGHCQTSLANYCRIGNGTAARCKVMAVAAEKGVAALNEVSLWDWSVVAKGLRRNRIQVSFS